MTLDDALSMATRLHSENKLAQAEQILNKILESNPKHANALHLLGIMAYQIGRTAAGIQFIQLAIESNPKAALFYSNLGEIHRQLNQLDLSIQYGQQAIKLDSDSALTWSNLGIAYYDAKQWNEAEACHLRALAINPTLGSSLNNMGSIYKEYGQMNEAAAYYLAAIEAAPHLVEPLNNWGVLLLQQQEWRPAVECFKRAIALAPNFAEAYCNLGITLLNLEYYDEAFAHFKHTLQLSPHHVEAYHGLAKIFLYQQNFIESENYIRQAMSLAPLDVSLYQHLASIYNEQGDYSKALFYLNQARALNPNSTSLQLSQGSVLMEMGETAQAEALFLNVTQKSQVDTSILAHYSLVQLKKTRLDSPSLKALLSLARNIENVPQGKREYVYFALGKCFDDLGEWHQAFEYFTLGCHVKRKRISYNIADQIQFTQQLIHCFTEETIHSLRAFANPSKQPIFIVGMPRSGSTLVEQILSTHPHVHGAGELKYLYDLIRSPIVEGNTTLHYPTHILKLPPDIYRMITDKYLSFLRRFAPDAPRIVDKMLYNFVLIGFIHAVFPNAKIIHVKRNPIDTCLSCYTKLFSQGQLYSYDLAELGQYYIGYQQIMNHWQNILPSNAWLDVEYETMVHHLEIETKYLLEYCDLPWDPSCLAFYESKRSVRTASFMQVRQPIYTSSIERWRRYEQELAPLINILDQSNSKRD